MMGAEGFAVNGRFLGQPVTGVQRYARNVVAAIDRALAGAGGQAPIMAPPGVPDPGFAVMPLRRVGPLSGHPWEQLVLPARWRGPLLNLCNTAPAVRSQQIVCIHDANAFLAPEAYSRSFRTFYKTLQPILARKSARITTVSTFSAGQIARQLRMRLLDIVVLPNGCEHAAGWDPGLARIAPPVLEATPSGNREPFVLAIGSRARHKNLDLLLQIAPQLAAMNVSIIVAGGTSSVFSGHTLSERPNLRTIGYVTDHDLAYLMDRALCLAFPSWTEGFGLPILEAMTRGCPVVSSDRASMPEVCGKAALMASPDDPAAWVRQIRRLLDGDGLRAELIGRGRERAPRFSWTATAAGYVDLLQGAAAR